MQDHKITYRHFCEGAIQLPLFLHAWWLDLVCTEGHWDVALSFDKGGEIRGVLPFFLTKTMGITTIRIPLLTPYLGLWINYPENPQKRERQYAFEKKVIGELLDQLPAAKFINHHHPVALDNGLPFFWKNYELSSLYTYRIAAKTPLTEIKSDMKASVRNKIEHASQNLQLIETNDPEAFYSVNQLSFDRQGLSIPYSLSFFKGIDQVLASKKQRKILVVNDQQRRVHAAIYLVWDQNTLYNLALGGDTELRRSGAIQWLLWQAIQLAMEKGLHFDFEGSMIEPIEGIFRDFGGERIAYLRTTKYHNRWWKALATMIRGK